MNPGSCVERRPGGRMGVRATTTRAFSSAFRVVVALVGLRKPGFTTLGLDFGSRCFRAFFHLHRRKKANRQSTDKLKIQSIHTL
jgi:hypothetical protein